MKTRYKNVTLEPDRHGKLRAVYRKGGKKLYLKALPDQPGFETEYKTVSEGRSQIDVRHIPRSIHDLCTRYYKSAAFIGKSGAEDRRRRKAILETFRTEFGNDMVEDFGFEHIEAILIARTVKRKNDKGRWIGGEVAAMNLREQLARIVEVDTRSDSRRLRVVGLKLPDTIRLRSSFPLPAVLRQQRFA